MLNGHSSSIHSVAFSYNDKYLASASSDKTVKIWDIASGACHQNLEGHSAPVSSIAFSHDDKYLASALMTPMIVQSSMPNIDIKIWDTASGTCLQTLVVSKSLVNNITPRIPLYKGLSVSSDDTWIMCNSENLLWLPSEYRPLHSAVPFA